MTHTCARPGDAARHARARAELEGPLADLVEWTIRRIGQLVPAYRNARALFTSVCRREHTPTAHERCEAVDIVFRASGDACALYDSVRFYRDRALHRALELLATETPPTSIPRGRVFVIAVEGDHLHVGLELPSALRSHGIGGRAFEVVGLVNTCCGQKIVRISNAAALFAAAVEQHAASADSAHGARHTHHTQERVIACTACRKGS